MRFALGDHVSFSDTVKKSHSEKGGDVIWESAGLPLDYYADPLGPARKVSEGIVIGHRTLTDYDVYTETDYGEYGVSYGTYVVARPTPGTARRAWLVAYDLRRKPVLVLDSDIEAAVA